MTIIFEKNNHLATITFNRIDAMNSLNETMANDLLKAIKEIENDHEVKVVVLQGAGNCFMAGGDVGFFYQNLNNISDHVARIIDVVHEAVLRLQNLNVITLAIVHGSVAGIGISFMLACDLVIAAQETKFTLAYSKIGVSPDGGSSYFLPRIVGNKKAMELILFSDVFDANDAKNHGLINWVVNASDLKQKSSEIIEKIIHAPSAYKNIKKLLQQTWDNSLETQLQAEKKSFVALSQSKDFAEGVSAFVQKRKPKFVGK